MLAPDTALNYPGEPFNWQKSEIKYAETDKGIIESDFYVLLYLPEYVFATLFPP